MLVKWRRRLARGAALAAACAGVATSTACTFPDFAVKDGVGGSSAGAGSVTTASSPWSPSNVDDLGFSLLGEATLGADGVDLTHISDKGETGVIVQRQELDLEGEPTLHIAAGFRIQPGTTNGDGLAVVIHAGPNGYRTLGSGGGGLGYGGIEPCVAVELDTGDDAGGDMPAPHLALMEGCIPEVHGARASNLDGDPSDGKDWSLSVDWDTSTLLKVSLRDAATGHVATISKPLDLTQLVGRRIFVAVTAATGEFRARHSVQTLELWGGGVSARRLAN